MSDYFNLRVVGLTLLMILALGGVLAVTHVEVIPCLNFVSDSDQGYYWGTCALLDEDGEWIFAGGYYDSIPSKWTWPIVAILFLGLPYRAAVSLNRWLSR